MNLSRFSLLLSALDWARFLPGTGLLDWFRSSLAASLLVVLLDLNLADWTLFYFSSSGFLSNVLSG